jgi:branched-chain amino acid transport system ATP-binding protein
MAAPALQIDALMKRYGGIAATDHVTLEITEGEVHGLIGPNGAGKTTLISQIAGERRQDSGSIRFAGVDISHLDVSQRVHLGLARSFQITELFSSLTVEDNVALAIQARSGHSYRFWKDTRQERNIRDQARALLADVLLDQRALVRAGELSHGEQRQLELAMALGTAPRMLLLDEPMAGMGGEESQRMLSLLRKMKRKITMLLVEHDMNAVFGLSDRVSVLVYGRLIATGSPDDIRSSSSVRDAYLGDGDA